MITDKLSTHENNKSLINENGNDELFFFQMNNMVGFKFKTIYLPPFSSHILAFLHYNRMTRRTQFPLEIKLYTFSSAHVRCCASHNFALHTYYLKTAQCSSSGDIKFTFCLVVSLATVSFRPKHSNTLLLFYRIT